MPASRKTKRGLKPLTLSVPKVLNVGARLTVADNSGAKVAEIIAVKHYKGVHSRIPRAGVGDIVIVAIKEGNPDMKHQVVPAVIIRQKKEFRRADGTRIKFEDNACVILKDLENYDPKGTIIKGPIPSEVAKRYVNVGRIASVVV